MALQGTPVCRYPLDEAASGAAPTSALDISGNAYHLTTMNYGSSTMAYTEVSGNRGLVSSSISGTHRASRAIDNTTDALRDAMASTQQATLEVVINLGAGNASGGRIAVITDRAGGTGQFGLRNNSDADNWTFVFNGSSYNLGVAGTTGLTLGSRHVLQIVLDTTQATQNDRVRICVNGGSFIQVSNTITLNATLSMGSNLDWILLNREDGGNFARSVDGTLFYVALYDAALTLGQCQNNATDLAADDDPAGGAGGSTATAAAGAATVSAAGASAAAATATAAAGVATVSGVGGTLVVLVSDVFKNNTGTVLASLTDVTVWVNAVETGALVVKLTGQVTDGSGILTAQDAAISTGTTYRVTYRDEDTGAWGAELVTAT